MPTNIGNLWPHQGDASAAYFASGRRAGTVAIPTGGGKSRVALVIWEKLDHPRLLVVVPTQDLVLQWEKVIISMGVPASNVGLYYTHRKELNRHIVITTYASLRAQMEKLFAGRKLIVFDEIHHLEGHITRTKIIPYLRNNSPDAHVLGLSATFKFAGREKRKMVKGFCPVVYECSTKKLIDEGFLADPTLVGMPVTFNPDEAAKFSKLQRDFTKVYQQARKMHGPDMSRWPRGGSALLGKVYWLMNEKNNLRTQLKRKDEAMLQALTDEDRKRSGNLKAMVFTSHIPHLERLEALLNRNRISAKVVHSKLKWQDRKQRLADWTKGRFKVLLVAEIGGEGLDVPEANVGVIIGGAKNKEKAIQKMGRILRQVKKKSKMPTIYFIYVPIIEDIWLSAATSELGRPVHRDSRFEAPDMNTKAVLEGHYGEVKTSPIPGISLEPVAQRIVPFRSAKGYDRWKEIRLILAGREDSALYDEVVRMAREYHANPRAPDATKNLVKMQEQSIYGKLSGASDPEMGWKLIRNDVLSVRSSIRNHPPLPDFRAKAAPPPARVPGPSWPTYKPMPPPSSSRQISLFGKPVSTVNIRAPSRSAPQKAAPPPSRLVPGEIHAYIRRHAPLGRWKVMQYFVGRGKGPLEIITEITRLIEKGNIYEQSGRLTTHD